MQGPIDLQLTEGHSLTCMLLLLSFLLSLLFIVIAWQLISSVDLHALFLSDYVGVHVLKPLGHFTYNKKNNNNKKKRCNSNVN